jgi:enoyl-CoA hydratase/carnithine racemase
MTAPRILRADEAGLCTLTLNRPDKLNALDTEAFDELDAHLADLETNIATIGCVVLRGSGRAFCAGADLDAMGLRADGSPVNQAYKPGVIERLSALPQTVIAAIHGICFTGGIELALACDLIVADPDTRMADTHGNWGLVAAWGMLQRLPRRIGKSRAHDLMVTGREIDGREAFGISLVDRVSEPGNVDAAAVALARTILANSWHTTFAIKRSQRQTDGMPLADALAYDQAHDPGSAPDFAQRLRPGAKAKP